jgi:hypothetical protein
LIGFGRPGIFTLVSAWVIGVRQQLGFLSIFTSHGNNGDTAWGELPERSFILFPFAFHDFFLGLRAWASSAGRRVPFFMGGLFYIFFGVHEHEEETKKENRANGWLSGLYGWFTGGGIGVDFLCHCLFFSLIVFPMFSLSHPFLSS